ncbi:MAG: formate-dependent phosphoribosylglycinamide formyltransferase [Deltaproteobacteria bacterium]|nr:MAG: formate-dependent phosphoribosylglycinamide formyltransferase [Deltaproteobacteria bacterium]
MILGAGELGREVVISAKRLGYYIIAVDSYEGAPAMQLADAFEVINMLDADQLDQVVKKHEPTHIIPEIEAIRTEKLKEFEDRGINVIPTAEATYLTMNRVAIREVASKELNLRTAQYAYAQSAQELKEKAMIVGLPCVIKPIMSSSGKGQSILTKIEDFQIAWDFAAAGMRGNEQEVIIEEFIQFDSEITLLTVKQRNAETFYVKPIGHRQENGDYRESWLPADISPTALKKAQEMAKKVTDRLGGAGVFGVEFFIKDDEVIFSELSPRPHDTGMVTLISQDLSEFDLHVRAILGLPIPKIQYVANAAASAVILADRESKKICYKGIDQALAIPDTEIRIFRKPTSRPNRRMGVALARGENIEESIKKAKEAASLVHLEYEN